MYSRDISRRLEEQTLSQTLCVTNWERFIRRELIGTNCERTLAKHVILIKRVAYSQVGQVSHRKHGLVSWRCRGKLANAGKWGFRASAHCCFGRGAFARGTCNFVAGFLGEEKFGVTGDRERHSLHWTNNEYNFSPVLLIFFSHFFL